MARKKKQWQNNLYNIPPPKKKNLETVERTETCTNWNFFTVEKMLMKFKSLKYVGMMHIFPS